MQDIADQFPGGTLFSAEYNQHKNSNQNAIESSGQTLSAADGEQLGKAMASYASVSTFYTDSGVADAYVLTPIDSLNAPETAVNGEEIRFRASNVNTGAATVNINIRGAVDIKKANGTTDPDPGDIPADKDTYLRFDSANTAYTIIELGAAAVTNIQAVTKAISQTSHGFIEVDHDIVRVSGGEYVKALADTLPNAQGVAVVIAVADVNNFTLQFSGYSDQLTGLTANTLHYLDASTAGANTTTEPTISKPMIFADTTTSGWILPQRPIDTSISGTGWETISTSVASADTEVDIALNTSTYSQFEIECRGVSSSSADDSLNVRFSNNGGSTFRSGASDYAWFIDVKMGGATDASDAADSEIQLIQGEIGNSGDDKTDFLCRISGASSAAKTMIFTDVSGLDEATQPHFNLTGGQVRAAIEDNDAIRFLLVTGNISGTFILRGYRGT